MGMTGPSTSGKGRATPHINMTPLVDVVLVVLIIFMIVTLTMTKTFWLNLPPKADAKDEPPVPSEIKPVVMTVDKTGVIRVNQTVLTKKEIAGRLPRLMAGAQQKVLYFDAADEASYGTAIEAMDLSRASGIKTIAILTEKVAQ
jgi:biopolymer transport protein ExbD/biopolymer transport protein TolR